MYWNEADEIIRSIQGAPKEEILEAFRAALLASPKRDPRDDGEGCVVCGTQQEFGYRPILPETPRSGPTPFYLALHNAKAAR